MLRNSVDVIATCSLSFANEGIGQVVFLESDERDVSYEDRGSKYQGQTGLAYSLL